MEFGSRYFVDARQLNRAVDRWGAHVALARWYGLARLVRRATGAGSAIVCRMELSRYRATRSTVAGGCLIGLTTKGPLTCPE
jgi:hypothetical protein